MSDTASRSNRPTHQGHVDGLLRAIFLPWFLAISWGLIGVAVGVCVTVAAPESFADVIDVVYSFADDDSGGVGTVSIDDESGQIISTEAIFDAANCMYPLKVRRSEDKQTIAVTNIATDRAHPNLILWSAHAPTAAKGLRLKSNADEMRIAGGFALLTLKKDDSVAAIDLDSHEILRQPLDEILTPPANSPEDLIVAPNGQHIVVSLQKDSTKGKKRGNRIVILTRPDLRIVADLALPRDRTDLHIPGNLEQQGPGPEVLYISEASDTLAVTLDLYGAVGLMDWSDALAGSTEDWTVVSTSESGKMTGQSFPDRAAVIPIDGREYYLVCNAGKQGGSVLIDLEKRDVVWRMPSPPGLEAPVFIPALRQAFSVCSGKTKYRENGQVKKNLNRLQDLFVFDFATLPAEKPSPVRRIPLDAYTKQIKLVSDSPPLLLVAVGQDALGRADTLLTVDPVTGTIQDRRSAVGPVERFER